MKPKTKQDKTPNEVKTLGYVTIDSGSVMICDPSTVSGDGFTDDDFQKNVVELMLDKDGKETGKTQVKGGRDSKDNLLGVVHGTRWGDGIYEVCGVFNSNDEILAMMISFDDEMNDAIEGEA